MSEFYNPTKGQLTFKDVVGEIISMLRDHPKSEFDIVVGSDSHASSEDREVDFVSAIVVHHVGKGGRYFWKQKKVEGIYTLRDKIYKEALLSFDLAKDLMEELEERVYLDYNLEIHVDAGQKGDTKEIIDEVVGMIMGTGFQVRTKPESYGASTVADKHA